MSIKLVEREVTRFLKDPEPEFMCIMGKWGVGKTYAWTQFLKEAIARGSPKERLGVTRAVLEDQQRA